MPALLINLKDPNAKQANVETYGSHRLTGAEYKGFPLEVFRWKSLLHRSGTHFFCFSYIFVSENR